MDPKAQRQAQQVLASAQARRERDQAHLAALQERQQHDAGRYTEDRAWRAATTQMTQQRGARMVSCQQLIQRLGDVWDQLEQARHTSERL
jgi:hypothetical protein